MVWILNHHTQKKNIWFKLPLRLPMDSSPLLRFDESSTAPAADSTDPADAAVPIESATPAVESAAPAEHSAAAADEIAAKNMI